MEVAMGFLDSIRSLLQREGLAPGETEVEESGRVRFGRGTRLLAFSIKLTGQDKASTDWARTRFKMPWQGSSYTKAAIVSDGEVTIEWALERFRQHLAEAGRDFEVALATPDSIPKMYSGVLKEISPQFVVMEQGCISTPLCGVSSADPSIWIVGH